MTVITSYNVWKSQEIASPKRNIKLVNLSKTTILGHCILTKGGQKKFSVYFLKTATCLGKSTINLWTRTSFLGLSHPLIHSSLVRTMVVPTRFWMLKLSALFLERVDLICDGRQKPVALSANCDKQKRNGGNLKLC